jgi:predicted dehydrogenase
MALLTDPDTARKPLAVALVGCGNWGANILRDLRQLDCEVPVVARSAASVERARAGGASLIAGSVADLPPVDGVIVATLTVSHAEVIDQVAAVCDCPIYVEKPICVDPEEADRLAAAYGDRLFVMDKWRYHPGVLELARIAATGELGCVRALHTRRVTNQNPHRDVDTVWIHLPHDLAIALEILGDVPEARFAVAERTGSARVGLLGTVGSDPWMTFEVSEAAPGHRRELRMICDGGWAQLDGGWAEQITIRRDGTETDEVRPTPGELPLLAELRAFVEHLRGGPPPKSSAAEAALQVRRIAELGELADASLTGAVGSAGE